MGKHPTVYARAAIKLRGFGRNRSGATAIEFAIVLTPFLMLVFGIIGVGLFYFTETVLDQAVTSSGRQIRTGMSHQTATGELKIGDLKKEICSRSAGLIDCAKLSLQIESEDNWADVSIPACTNSAGTVVASNYADTDAVSAGAGGRDRIVIVVACYPWQLMASIPYLKLGNVNSGSAQLISSVLAFKSEPY